MNLKVGEKHGGPKNLRARFLDQIWGKRFFPKDMPGSSVTKRGSNHWKAGPGWILGKVVENIRIQCVFILYIYMYNIYVCIYIYTYIYHLIIFHLKKSETHMNETAAWLSSCCIPSRFLTDWYETLGKMSQDEVPQKVHFSEGNGTFAPKCWKGNLTAWGVLRLWMVLVSQRPQTMLALRGLRTCKTTCLTINGLGRKQCYGIFMCDGSWCLL